MSLKRKRVQRDFTEKKEIIDFYESIKHEFGAKTKTIKEFHLTNVSSLNKILAIKKNIDDLIENKSLCKRKRTRKGLYPLIDENLYNYLLCVRTQDGKVSTINLQNKAMEIAKKLGFNDFQASNGYMEGFKARYNVKFKTLNVEAENITSKAQPVDIDVNKNAVSQSQIHADNIDFNRSILDCMNIALKISKENVSI
jgi:hypothetical protein